MQIVVKKKVLEALVDKLMREVSSFHSVRIDEIPAKVDEEDLIKPAEEMSTQLSQQKPKVDDPNYKPDTLQDEDLMYDKEYVDKIVKKDQQ